MSSDDVINRLHALRSTLQADEPLRLALERAFDAVGFTSEAARADHGGAKRKSIKDNVWGMIDLGPCEVALVDSPLLQRLRDIRQLGLTYLTYPSAEHSRFVHALGMAHVASRLLDGIDRRSDGEPATSSARTSDLGPLRPRELLYAAMLHGVGNMPLSRASEAALSDGRTFFRLGGVTVAERLASVRAAVGLNVPLSVAMSMLIVLSARFADFYARMDPESAAHPRSLLRIAAVIVGARASPASPNVQNVVSAAAADANKIDYINRDARACGIAIGVDTSRIFLGGRLVRAEGVTFDPSYEGERSGLLYAFNASGSDTLAEIAHARSTLYQRVYLHPATLAAEAMLAKALTLNVGAGERCDPGLVEALDLWALSDAELIHRISCHDDERISRIGRDLRFRRLPKKACALSASLVSLQVSLQDQFGDDLLLSQEDFARDVGTGFVAPLLKGRPADEGSARLERAVREEAGRLTSLLRSVDASRVPSGEVGEMLLTGVAILEGAPAAALVVQNGRIAISAENAGVPTRGGAYDAFRATGYMMCDPAWRQVVFQATRTVLYNESIGREVEPSMACLMSEGEPVAYLRQTLLDLEATAAKSNLALEDARAFADFAAETGYYDAIPLLARRTDHLDKRVQRVAELYSSFDGERGWRVRPSTVAAFVDQFPPKLRPPLLEVLAAGTLLNQAGTVRRVNKALSLAASAGFADAVLVPLSSSSGGSVSAMVRKDLPHGMVPAVSMVDALGMAGRPILMVDDNAVSGVQSAAQLHSFLEGDPATWPVDLRGEDGLFSRLSDDQAYEFRARRVGIAVAVGAERAGTRLDEAAACLGLVSWGGLHVGETLAAGLKWEPALKTFLTHVGRDLLAMRRSGCLFNDLEDGSDDREYCRARGFGFGNHGGITITNHNVPASTVTALWQPGVLRGRPWIPLFMRRGRFADLTLA